MKLAVSEEKDWKGEDKFFLAGKSGREKFRQKNCMKNGWKFRTPAYISNSFNIAEEYFLTKSYSTWKIIAVGL